MKVQFFNGLPTPEEFQRQLSELMRQHFQGGNPTLLPKAESAGAAEEPPGRPAEDPFKFDYKPREVKAYLDRFVIKQEEAKQVLSVALFDHYHHVRLALAGRGECNYHQ